MLDGCLGAWMGHASLACCGWDQWRCHLHRLDGGVGMSIGVRMEGGRGKKGGGQER